MDFPRQLDDGMVQVVIEWLRQPGASVLVAVLVLLVGWYLSGQVVSALRGNVLRRSKRRSVANLVLRGIRAAIVLGALFVTLPVLGFDAGNLLISMTVISAVIGVVLAPLAQNAISGMLILVNRPYEIGDMVEIADQEQRGYVDNITLRYTRIVTLNNTFLLIPNETINGRDIINLSGEDERTRVSPEFADHGIRIDLLFWVRRPYLPVMMRSQVHENLWKAFEDADIEIPYPHTHLVFDETSGQAKVTLERDQIFAETGAGQRAESTTD